MRNILFISLLLSGKTFGQDYVHNWVGVPKEPNVINYQIQESINNITFITIPNGTISPKKSKDSNRYSYTIKAANKYVRLKTLMSTTTLYTPSKRIINTNVTITNAILKINPSADNLIFTATNEGAINYYSIERQNSSSSKWVIVGKLWQTNKRNYMVNISKVGVNRKYKFRAVYKNEIVSPYISFN